MTYLNKQRIADLIETKKGQSYWKQSLALTVFWNWRKSGETYVTLEMAWYTVKETIKWIENGKPAHECAEGVYDDSITF